MDNRTTAEEASTLAGFGTRRSQAVVCWRVSRRWRIEVNHSKMKWIALVFALAAILMLGACKKKVAPAAAPAAAAPTGSDRVIDGQSGDHSKGQSTTLTWQTANATDVSIEGVGPVQPSGSQRVSPQTSTTYRLMAKGPGRHTGRHHAGNGHAASAASAASADCHRRADVLQNVHDLYFDYDKYDIRPDQQATLQADAQWLAAHPNVRFTIEGHCDERGSTEYNMALGDNRANAVKQALVQAGVAADRIKTVSFGKEKPFCTEDNEGVLAAEPPCALRLRAAVSKH